MVSKRGQAVLISLQAQRNASAFLRGALAQLGERLICIQEVIGSIPIGSTKHEVAPPRAWALGTCLKKVHRTFLSGVARTACGSVAQVVRAHA
jgi:hypothetical protein